MIEVYGKWSDYIDNNINTIRDTIRSEEREECLACF